MTSWPADWIVRTLEAVEVAYTQQSSEVMRAWKKSTPLPPMTNNPIGMPKNSCGNPAYLTTEYAIFPSMNAFYACFAVFAETHAGKRVIAAMNDSAGYPVAWRTISDLNWPASKTETDYPSAILDLTSQSYRDSVNASNPGSRKTSGLVGSTSIDKPSVLMQAALVNQVTSTIHDARAAVRAAIQQGVGNGG